MSELKEEGEGEREEESVLREEKVGAHLPMTAARYNNVMCVPPKEGGRRAAAAVEIKSPFSPTSKKAIDMETSLTFIQANHCCSLSLSLAPPPPPTPTPSHVRQCVRNTSPIEVVVVVFLLSLLLPPFGDSKLNN